ncbi:LamG domain-containing protein [Neptunomonas sp.]|uniref:LamG domain-containing protein n=1 Tax=Neptunomonas sp. TaxID=1971898 RepID=UPI003566B402
MNKLLTGSALGMHPNLVLYMKLDAIEVPDKTHTQARILDALGSEKPVAIVDGFPKIVADERFGCCLKMNNAHGKLSESLCLPMKNHSLDTGFTLSCWLYIESDPAVILAVGDTLIYVQNSQLKCWFNNKAVLSETFITEKEWRHLTICLHEDGVEFYVDVPERQPAKLMGPGIDLVNDKPWTLGYYSDGWAFNGKFAQLRVYDNLLSFEEIKQQWLQDNAAYLPQSFCVSAPLEFEFWDEKHQPIIYTEGGEISHKLSIALRNNDAQNRPLLFADVKNNDSDMLVEQFIIDNHHIELRFPKATLSGKSIQQINEAYTRRLQCLSGKSKASDGETQASEPALRKDDWCAFYIDHPELNAESVYLMSPVEQSLEVSDDMGDVKVMEIELPHLCVDTGAYSIPVEMRPGPLLSYAGEASNLGKRIRNLQIQTQKGYKVIPLHFDVVGSNTVLNDGSSTKLLLRLTNIDPVRTIKIKDTGNMQSQFILSCELSNHGGHHEWSLTDEASKVTVEVSRPNILQPECQNDKHWQSDSVESSENGDKVEWVINGSRLGTDSLAPNQSIYLRFTVKTKLPTGASDLHVHYRKIEGYWDGNRSWPLEKSPLVFHRSPAVIDRSPAVIDRSLLADHVGIGTNKPASKLSVTDGLSIGVTWSNRHQAPAGGLLVEGNVGFGIFVPEARLHVHQGRLRVSDTAASAVIELKNDQHNNVLFTDGATGHLNIRTNSSAHHVALQSGKAQGNVGIGTDVPKSKLAVVGGITLGDADFVKTTAARPGSLHLQNDVNLSKDTKIHFADNGEISSLDDNHRILFRRNENVMELREFGNIVFSPGATSGQATNKVTVSASGLSVDGFVSNKNTRRYYAPHLNPLINNNVRRNLTTYDQNFSLRCTADVLFLVQFSKVTVHHDGDLKISLDLLHTERGALKERLKSIDLMSRQYNSKDQYSMSQSMFHIKFGLSAHTHYFRLTAQCSGSYVPIVEGCTIYVIQL